jgi:hypothetical protein
MTLADLAEYVFCRYFYIIEKYLTGRRALDTELVLLSSKRYSFGFSIRSGSR